MIYSLDEIEKMSNEELEEKVLKEIREKLEKNILVLDLSSVGLGKYKLIDFNRKLMALTLGDEEEIYDEEYNYEAEDGFYDFYLYSPMDDNSKYGQLILEYENYSWDWNDCRTCTPIDSLIHFIDKECLGLLKEGVTQEMYQWWEHTPSWDGYKKRDFKNYDEFMNYIASSNENKGYDEFSF